MVAGILLIRADYTWFVSAAGSPAVRAPSESWRNSSISSNTCGHWKIRHLCEHKIHVPQGPQAHGGPEARGNAWTPGYCDSLWDLLWQQGIAIVLGFSKELEGTYLVVCHCVCVQWRSVQQLSLTWWTHVRIFLVENKAAVNGVLVGFFPL